MHFLVVRIFLKNSRTKQSLSLRQRFTKELLRLSLICLEQYEQKLSEEVEEVTESLTTKLDDYLNYVVEEWMQENELAVDSGIRTEVAESFMDG